MRFASVLLLAAGTLASVLLTPDSAGAWGRRGRRAAPPVCCPVVAPDCCAPGYYAPPGVYAPPGYYAPPTAGQPMPGYPPTAAGPAATRPTTTVAVSLVDDRFEPSVLNLAPGTTVRWTNNGRHPHTVTSSAGQWDSGDLQPFQGYSATFHHAGTYEYYCRHHQGMKGTIIVK